jgi:hypothetical protein
VVQYTAREVRTGLTFADYASTRSAPLACVFAERVIAHLSACGVDPHEVGFQTDNGSEYAGGKDSRGLPHGSKPTVEAHGLSHTFIPPSAHTYNSDVETVHRLCEDESFDRESFRDRPHFLAKVQSYWLYFNVARRNSHKQDRAPLALLREFVPHVNPRITLWPSAFLEDHLHLLLPQEIQRARGNDQPAHPLCLSCQRPLMMSTGVGTAASFLPFLSISASLRGAPALLAGTRAGRSPGDCAL